MIFHALFYAVFENVIQKFLCYLSLISMGFILIGISTYSTLAIHAAYSYLIIHIVYKSLLSNIISHIIDHHQITLISKIKKTNSFLIKIACLSSVFIMINAPMTSTFFSKIIITSYFTDVVKHFGMNTPLVNNDPYIYYLIIFISFLSIFILPWKDCLVFKNKSIKTISIKLNTFSKASILILILTTIYFGLINNITMLHLISLVDSLKQTCNYSFSYCIIIPH